jgi:activator of 2-hydroxyglutaryl-CoA dehydratase
MVDTLLIIPYLASCGHKGTSVGKILKRGAQFMIKAEENKQLNRKRYLGNEKDCPYDAKTLATGKLRLIPVGDENWIDWRAMDYEEKPSEHIEDCYWIFASSPAYKEEVRKIYKQPIMKKGMVKKSESKTGKWLIFVNRKNIDEVWQKIKSATEEGILGIEAKVSTATPKPEDIGYDNDTHVICVYTYDWTDEKDVKRVREELRKLGITNRIPYKTDEDTGKGKYRARGHKRISKYYE